MYSIRVAPGSSDHLMHAQLAVTRYIVSDDREQKTACNREKQARKVNLRNGHRPSVLEQQHNESCAVPNAYLD